MELRLKYARFSGIRRTLIYAHTLILTYRDCGLLYDDASLLNITQYRTPRLSHGSHWLIPHAITTSASACVLSSLGALAKQILAANTLSHIYSTIAVAVIEAAAAAAAAPTVASK